MLFISILCVFFQHCTACFKWTWYGKDMEKKRKMEPVRILGCTSENPVLGTTMAWACREMWRRDQRLFSRATLETSARSQWPVQMACCKDLQTLPLVMFCCWHLRSDGNIYENKSFDLLLQACLISSNASGFVSQFDLDWIKIMAPRNRSNVTKDQPCVSIGLSFQAGRSSTWVCLKIVYP